MPQSLQPRKAKNYLLRRIVRRGLVDTLIVLLAYSTAFLILYLAHKESAWATVPIPGLWGWIVIVVLSLGVNAVLGFYQRIWGSGSVMEPLWLLVSTGMSALLLYEINHLLYPAVDVFASLFVCGAGGVLMCAGFLLVRYRLFIWRRFRQKTYDGAVNVKQSRVLIVGMTREAQQLAIHLAQGGLRRFKIVGFIYQGARHRNMTVVRWPVLGEPEDIPRITEEEQVDVILIVQNGLSGIDLNDLIGLCQETSAQIRILPDGLDVLNNPRWDLSVLRDATVEDLLGREQAIIDEAMCHEIITGKIVLVTGASGSIGSELCRQITNYNPARLIVLDNNESALHDLGIELERKLDRADLRLVLADITHGVKMKELFETERPQLVFHAAAYKHVPMLEIYPEEAVRVNVLGTMVMSEYAARYDVERFVFISTDKAVNPESVMGASKRICEIWLRALNRIAGRTTYTIVRFGNVIGSRGSVVPIFKRQIEWGGPLTVTHKDMTRYLMSIPEAVSLVLHAMTLGNRSETYMLDMGKRVSILDLAHRMIRLRGLRVNDDIAIKFTGIRPGEKLHEELYYGNEVRRATKHPRIYCLRNDTQAPELKTVLGAILLLADAAQRQNISHILRRAVLIAAYQDWDTFVGLVKDMGLLESYQPPFLLQDSSVLLDQDIVYTFVQEYSMPEVVPERVPVI